VFEGLLEALASINPYLAIGFIIIVGGAVGLQYTLKKKAKQRPVVEVSDPLSPRSSVMADGKFKAYVWYRGNKIVPTRITKPIGNELLFDPSLPQSGANFVCLEDEEGEFIPYDARFQSIAEGETPTDCYEAVKCQEVAEVYVDFSSLWEKFKALVPYLIAGGEGLILLVLADKITGS